MMLLDPFLEGDLELHSNVTIRINTEGAFPYFLNFMRINQKEIEFVREICKELAQSYLLVY